MNAEASLKEIGSCGYYCTACRKNNHKNCSGCENKTKKNSCAIKACTLQKGISNCSLCNEFADISQCRHHNNPVKKLTEYLHNSDTIADINMIKTLGPEFYVLIMSKNQKYTISRF